MKKILRAIVNYFNLYAEDESRIEKAIAKYNLQMEEYVCSSVSSLESELRNELANHGQMRDIERRLEGLQSQINELVNS